MEAFSRYGEALADPSGPVRPDLLSFEHLLDEPPYQLVRQQLLAHKLEKAGAEGASRARVVHVTPKDNLEYQQSLGRAEHRALGAAVSEVWSQLLRRPEKFLSLDSSTFLDPEITSYEYCHRYGAALIHDEAELLQEFGVEAVDGLEDSLDFDGDVHPADEGIELYLDGTGTLLAYPFTDVELHAVARELEAASDG